MQNCVQDVFDTIFSRYMCYDTISTYDTTLISLIINYVDTALFDLYSLCTNLIYAEWSDANTTIRGVKR
jgi:hypothetical protein